MAAFLRQTLFAVCRHFSAVCRLKVASVGNCRHNSYTKARKPFLEDCSVNLVKIVAIVAVVSAYVWAILGIACQSAGLIMLGAVVGALGAFFVLLSILCGE